MTAMVKALAIASVLMLGLKAPAWAQDGQWEGPGRAEIKTFVAEQKGWLDLPTPVAFYGDFNGDRQEDAVVFVYSDIEGAAGNFDLRVALFEGADGKYRFMRYAPEVYGLDPRDAKFSNGLVEITTTMPRPNDPHCCPTGSERYAIGTGAAIAKSEPWIGRWGAPQCDADATVITFSKSVLDLSTFDMTCKIRSVRRKGKLYVFALMCSGGGSTFKASFSVRVDGDRLEFVKQQPGFEFDPKRYRRCAENR